MRSPANRRTRSSSADRKKRDSPGSPWRPERPRSWLSMRRDSWRSVPQMNRPPACRTFSRPSSTRASMVGSTWAKRSSKSGSPGLRPSLASSRRVRGSAFPPSLMSTPRPALFVAVGADHRPVGRDLDHRQLVDLHELGRLGERRPRHAGELVVHAEVVLQRDRRERLVLLADAHALLGLDRLVEALRPAAAVEDAPGELVDDLDLTVDDGVVDVLLVQRLRLERLDQVVDEGAVLRLVQVVD